MVRISFQLNLDSLKSLFAAAAKRGDGKAHYEPSFKFLSFPHGQKNEGRRFRKELETCQL
jgi:hypothetical protein